MKKSKKNLLLFSFLSSHFVPNFNSNKFQVIIHKYDVTHKEQKLSYFLIYINKYRMNNKCTA